ncbi:MAG TPA: hypothetical protein DDW80_04835, partial [Desulfovibrio sp.]|nr:hypothetical protein [Desulfovibrio sp.]
MECGAGNRGSALQWRNVPERDDSAACSARTKSRTEGKQNRWNRAKRRESRGVTFAAVLLPVKGPGCSGGTSCRKVRGRSGDCKERAGLDSGPARPILFAAFPDPEDKRDQPVEDLFPARPAHGPDPVPGPAHGRPHGPHRGLRLRPGDELRELLVFGQDRAGHVQGPAPGPRGRAGPARGPRGDGGQGGHPHAAPGAHSARSAQRLRHGPQPAERRGGRDRGPRAPAAAGRGQGRHGPRAGPHRPPRHPDPVRGRGAGLGRHDAGPHDAVGRPLRHGRPRQRGARQSPGRPGRGPVRAVRRHAHPDGHFPVPGVSGRRRGRGVLGPAPGPGPGPGPAAQRLAGAAHAGQPGHGKHVHRQPLLGPPHRQLVLHPPAGGGAHCEAAGNGREVAVRRVLLALFCVLFLVQSACAQSEDLRRTPVVRAVQAVGPAVVNITSSRLVQSVPTPFGGQFSGPLFERFLRDFGLEVPAQKAQSLGSGVLIDGRRGFVLTNAHVIEGASEIAVRLQDGRELAAKVRGADPDLDLAVLQVDPAGGLPQAEMGDSSTLFIGETVIAIGNPYGYTNTVTTGVVSAVGRSVGTDEEILTDLIQTDAAINPGNSGGPLLNLLGQVIGINTAIQADAQGIGFAIPVNKAKRVLDELINVGHVTPVWLGLFGQDLDQPTAGYLGLKSPRGVLVT